MEYVNLGDVATYINGYAFKPEHRGKKGLPIIRIQDLNGNSHDLGFFDGEYPEQVEINTGDILISWSGSLGVYKWNKGKALLNQHIFKVLFNKIEIDKEYFCYAIRNSLSSMSQQTHGATMKHITKKDFDNISIPYPNLDEQKKIANNLNIVNKLIMFYEKELILFEQMVKARFVEMFCHKGYTVLEWNDVFNTRTGKLDSNAATENGKYPFFTCSKDILYIDDFGFDQEALLLAGNNAAGKYDVKYYKGKFNAYQRTYVLTLRGNWSYQLFRYQLEDKLEYLRQQSLGGLTKYLTMKILGELSFIIPPIEKQKEFESFVQQVDKSRFDIKKSIIELEREVVYD